MLNDYHELSQKIILNDFYHRNNTFDKLLGKNFIVDIANTISATIRLLDENTFTIKCPNGKVMTISIDEKNKIIEILFPELFKDPERKTLGFKKTTRKGLMKPKFAFLWRNFITQNFAHYNNKH